MDVEWADLHPALVVWGWRHKAGKGCVSYRWELEAVKKLKLEYTKAVFAADDDEGGTDSSSEVRIVSRGQQQCCQQCTRAVSVVLSSCWK